MKENSITLKENSMSDSDNKEKKFSEIFSRVIQKEKLVQRRPAERGKWTRYEGAATTSLGDKLVEAVRED